MQASVPCANLGTGVLGSSSQRGQETDLKKAPRTPANNSAKRNMAVMQQAEEPYISDESPEPQRKVAHQVGAMDATIEVALATLDGELHLSLLPADRPGPPNSPPLFSPNLGHAASYSEHAEARRSAQHLLMLASLGEQPVNTLASQVGMPGRIHSPSDPATSDVSADIPADKPDVNQALPLTPQPTQVHTLQLVSSGYNYDTRFLIHSVGKVYRSTGGRNARWEPAQVRYCPSSLALPTKLSCPDQCG